MGILKEIFGSAVPSLRKEDITDAAKVAELANWFIKNDRFAKPIGNPSCNVIFGEGYRPKSGTENTPEAVNTNIRDLTEWFVTKLFIDLNLLKDANREEFKSFLDMLGEASDETLANAGKIAMKYDLNLDSFVYENEIKKIPEGTEREWFKVNFLDDAVSAAEMRMLAWLYHQYFGEWYQPH